MDDSTITIVDVESGPPTVDIPTAARALGISRAYGYELVARGEFPVRVLRVGTRRRVPRTALLALLRGISEREITCDGGTPPLVSASQAAAT